MVATSLRDVRALPIADRGVLVNFETLPRGTQRHGYRAYFLSNSGRYACVASVLQLVDGNEMEGGGINDVSLARGRLRVGKDVAQAGITSLGAHLGALHLVCVVGHLDEEIFRNRFCECGQTDVAVELVD